MTKRWIQKAVKGKKGVVHRLLGIPLGKKIPIERINKEIRKLKKKAEKRGYFTKTELKNYRRLILAKTLKRISRKRKRR